MDGSSLVKRSSGLGGRIRCGRHVVPANATSIEVQIVRRIADQTGFVVHPRRWVVERTFAWLGRNRRLAKNFETTIAFATAFLYAASSMLLTRRLARSE